MIKVLRSKAEIDQAATYLAEHKLSKHHDRLKNWDLALLHQVIKTVPKSAKIIDLGCSGLAALKFLHFLKFRDIYGIDLTVTPREIRIQKFMMLKSLSLKLPFHLTAGDLTKTNHPAEFFDVAACISVIEHGVDLQAFFRETSRIVTPQGYLFITTDYWPEKMAVKADERPCGLDYNIFSRDEVLQLIELAGRHGFSLLENSEILDPLETNILGEPYRHTFVCLVFRKTFSNLTINNSIS